MKYLLSMVVLLTAMNTKTLFDFDKESNIRYWYIVNDTVMGGRSSSRFQLNEEGHGRFYGDVSLENNGGFASVRYRMPVTNVGGYTKLVFKLKGDGNPYQIRLKDDARRYYSYAAAIETSGDWEEVEVLLADMRPQFRGRVLNKPNFDHDSIEELAILIGNKKAQSFELLLDRVTLR